MRWRVVVDRMECLIMPIPSLGFLATVSQTPECPSPLLCTEGEEGSRCQPLLVAGDRAVNRLVGLEDFDELGDGEETFHLVGNASKPHLSPLILHGGHRCD